MKKIIKKMREGVLSNKLLSIGLILTILIIPFQTLLNVKAEEVVITTDETTLEGNSDFKHVTNTTDLTVSSSGDLASLSAYKILDIYYNKTTNEMTYGFTSDFKGFIDQLPSNDDFYNLTIEKYQALTGDYGQNAGHSVTTTSTLNKLVSKYAAYIRKDENVVVIKLNKSSSNFYTANVETGSYLILSTRNPEYNDNEVKLFINGVGVANAVFTVENRGWKLPACQVYVKDSQSFTLTALVNNSFKEVIETGEGISLDNITYSAKRELFYGFSYDFGFEIPTNTHSSITNNTTIMNKIDQREIIFPKGLTYDLNEIYSEYCVDDCETIIFYKITIKNNSIYGLENGGVTERKFADFTKNADTNSIILYNLQSFDELYFKLKTNDNTKLGTTTNADLLANYGNTITTNAYYLKDAYVDISGMSQEEAEAAVLGVGTLTNTVYTYGVKVTNKDNSTLLNGAKFQVYADEGCTEKVGEEFEITENGTYTFKGLNDTDTYYLKQTKASTGYKVADPVELNPTSLNKETGFYDVEVTSKKMGLLPSTGGLGTILYTTFGLLIIVVGSITFISYRKRQVNN